MRIVGGTYARRAITAPPGLTTRPTSDRARAAIFNILQHRDWGMDHAALDGATVLDVCCGTGALGLEALSRGARQVYFMERDQEALCALRVTIADFDCAAASTVMSADATTPPQAPATCDLIFLDPPYRQNLPARIVPALETKGWCTPHTLLVIETAQNEALPELPRWTVDDTRRYGAACVHFLLRAPS